MEYKEINYFMCHFEGFENGITYSKHIEGFNAEQFGKELKELMERHHVKSICPTHRKNAQISRHINDNEIHFVGIDFTSE